MRMMPEIGPRTAERDKKQRNSLNMGGSRTWYPHFRMVSWYPGKGEKGKNRQELLNQLGAWHHANNSTRGLTPGYLDETLGETEGNRVRVPDPSVRSGVRLQGGKNGDGS